MGVGNSLQRCLFYFTLCTFNKNQYRHSHEIIYKTFASFFNKSTSCATLSDGIIFTEPFGGGNSNLESFMPPSPATASTTFKGLVLADIIPRMLGIFHSAIGS